ncbi:type II toxin-antitoxin system PemK/MazF family toxin [Georgenia sp. MJ206]|uniref:type II toxin-antitoxin system PemK/MazF family toxin n=1 Tax=Georgenia wangjunii TaxID=3117730 RepID=UPI002F26093C
MNPLLQRVLRLARSTVTSAARRSSAGAGSRDGRAPSPAPRDRPTPTPSRPRASGPETVVPSSRGRDAADGATTHDRVLTRGASEYDVAALGLPALEYSPEPDDQPDPGEVVWAWVPYEDDPSEGKDRPVLVLAREGAGLVAAQMTSKDHDADRADEARHGRHWLDVGTGAWDSQGRESEVRLDRLLWLDPGAVRREGASLPRARFDEVARALRSLHG